MPSKGEFEIQYFGGPDNPAPNGGVNYSVPYTSLPPNDLAPGTVNTQSINGFLCSSPWISGSPYTLNFSGTPLAGEHILGLWEYTGALSFAPVTGGITSSSTTLIITNVGAYLANQYGPQVSLLQPPSLQLLHLWSNAEINNAFMFPGQAASFVQVGSFVYITGLMFKGIFFYNFQQGWGIATNYVTGRFIAELAGRLVVAECYFPGGGGTGAAVLPTIAWSGVGVYGQAWDGNAAHDVWNPLNQSFFNGNIGGFNLLGDVPDQITGMGLVGQSLIIIRTNGITQQDPNSTFSNSGLQPYNWYHMWSSAQGVGGISGSVSQFGQMLVFKSSDNIYSLSMSGGLSALAQKIIPRMQADLLTIQLSPGVYSAGATGAVTLYINPWWMFSTIYPLDGQLHYLLVLSTYSTNASSSPTVQNTACLAYDLNLSEGSWHVWDFSQYVQNSTAGSGFVGFSCPPSMQFPTIWATSGSSNIATISTPRLFLMGVFTSYGSPTASFPVSPGTLMSLNPFDYDISSTSNFALGSFASNMYVFSAAPLSTVVFRAEVLSLGHKITVRRIRVLVDNSTVPFILGQQNAQVVLNGESSSQTSTIVAMSGNSSPSGAAIRTYYFDGNLSDYSVQPTLSGASNQLSTFCAFRIASASLIGIDTTSTTQ